MLGALALAWALLQTGRFLLSALLPSIIESLAITEATAGIALGVFQVVYAVTQYPSGRLSDVRSRAALVLPGVAVLAVAFLVIGRAETFLPFFVGTLLLGVGKGLYAIPSRARLSDLFVERRGRALGIYAAGTDVGGLASALVAVVIVGASWRTPFFPIAVALALVGVVYGVWNREPLWPASESGSDDSGTAVGGVLATVRRLATTREQRLTLVAYSLFYFMVGGWINFLTTYLVAAKGFTQATAALGFSLVFAVGILTKPAAGALSDRFSRRSIAVGGLLLAAVALGGVVVATSKLAIGLAIAVLAVGYKTQFPLVDAMLLDAAPDRNAGGDLGAARAVFLGIGALGPAYVGVTATWFGYEVAFAGLAACLLACAGILAYARA
ncbi:MFS transporter [Natronomonas sp. EA1]|uniref:MFS transporter n=1 Tax=Natronomonas sp. EA1 TaxID=3421655 RepID=UPI003EBE6D57